MKKTNEIHYMEVNLLQKESGKFKRFDIQIPFAVIRGKAHLSDTDLNLISPYFDNANYLVLRYTPSELEINQTKYNKIDEKAVIDMKNLIKNEYGLDFIKTLKGKYHQPINAESKYDGVIDYYLIFGNKKLKEGGSIKSNGTLNPLGSAKELGIKPKIAGHDMIAICDCGEKFSYQNSKKYILWQCPECGSVNTNDLKVGDVILYKTFYPITFETDYKQTTSKAFGKIIRISQYGNKSFIVQPNSRFKSEKVVERKNVLGIGTEADMFLTS